MPNLFLSFNVHNIFFRLTLFFHSFSFVVFFVSFFVSFFVFFVVVFLLFSVIFDVHAFIM